MAVDSTARAARSMTATCRIAGDTRPFVLRVVNDATDKSLELGGMSATFKLITEDLLTTIVNDAPCDIVGSLIMYTPSAGEVSTPGSYLGRFKIVSDDGILKIGHVRCEIASDI